MSERPRTIDELAHETASSMLPEVTFPDRAAVVIVSEVAAQGGRTVWRFINCGDPRLQALALRQIADLVEKEAEKKPG